MRRAVLARQPLRVKLVAAVLLLVAIALAVAGFVAAHELRAYLVSTNDAQIANVLTSNTKCSLTATAAVAPPNTRGFGCIRAAIANDSTTRPQPPEGGNPGDRRGSGPPSPFVVQFSKADGSVVESVLNPIDAGEGRPQFPTMTLAEATATANTPFTVNAASGPTKWRVTAAPLADGSGSVMVAQSLGDIDRTMGRLAWLEAIIGAVVLLVVAFVGYLLVRRSLRPLEDVEVTAEAIAAGDLSRRVSHDAYPATEVGRLSSSLNGMLHQIESAFAERAASEASARDSEERMRRFVADASHELRTPLTSIHGFADLVGRGAVRDLPEILRFMTRIESESDRMRGLVEDLLLLARLDEQRPLDLVPVSMVDVAADVVLDAQAIEPDRSITLVLDDDDPPVAMADPARLHQIVTNLVRNALVHTPPSASVTVRIATTEADGARWAALEVIDDGPGLHPDDAARVFRRFYRADASRSRDAGGSGLGLSIVSALVDAQHGRVQLETELGHGATFRVLLPLADVQSRVPAG
jgi:two-component system OmpR family sensor kinase